MKKIVAAVLFAALFASQASADDVTFNARIKFAGTGCKPGSATVIKTKGNRLIASVTFNAYDAAHPPSKAASRMGRTACSFIMPVKVPSGYQVAAMTSSWQGFAEGDVGLHREYFVAGQEGPRRTTSPRGKFRERDKENHPAWSNCRGGVVPLRINSSVGAKSQQSYIQIEKVRFCMKLRKCRQENPPIAP
jgi:hypothetical protein